MIQMHNFIRTEKGKAGERITPDGLKSRKCLEDGGSELAGDVESGIRPKNNSCFKWSFYEHAQYVRFLEMNKLRIKTKLIRKSNAFFQEMQSFIQTKTSLQCRSHHQKFEERYRFPHRIITGQRKHIPAEIYGQVLEHAKTFISPTPCCNCRRTEPSIQPKPAAKMVSFSCQTDTLDLQKHSGIEDTLNQDKSCSTDRQPSEQTTRNNMASPVVSASYFPFLETAYPYYCAYYYQTM